MTVSTRRPSTVSIKLTKRQWELILRTFSATDDVEAIMAKLKIDKADLEDVYELCEAVRLAKRQLHGGERSS
jgi:hypothetical protein